jgi:hypothetical protein
MHSRTSLVLRPQAKALDMMVSHYDRDGNLMLGGVGFARGDPASQRSDRTTETRQQS